MSLRKLDFINAYRAVKGLPPATRKDAGYWHMLDRWVKTLLPALQPEERAIVEKAAGVRA